MIKYIGSKRVLVDRIVAIATEIPDGHTACDLFTGTTRVAAGLKRAGFDVLANDLASYSEVLARCYIEVDGGGVDTEALEAKLARLDALPGREGYFTRTFARNARYFRPENARRMDVIRPAIDEIADGEGERAILLTSLIEAADRVDSTTGLQMAYLKKWAPRAYNRMELRLPQLIAGPGRASRRDALELAGTLDEFDLVYIDPPYNQHSYFSNYHVWETLVRNDRPKPYGVAMKRSDCRENKSPFNSKRLAWEAFSRLIGDIRSRYILVSFSNEGFFSTDSIIELLESKGEVAVMPVGGKRYVGARIGIHNQEGRRVGKVSHLHNTEFLFLVGPDSAAILDSVQERFAGAGEKRGRVYSQVTDE